MNSCQNCNYDNPAGVMRCVYCGFPIADATPPADAPDHPEHMLLHAGGHFVLLEGQTYEFGRDPSADIPIASKNVSWRHARWEWMGSMPFIKDLGSKNGVHVNGKQVSAMMVSPGAELQIGPFHAIYQVRPVFALPVSAAKATEAIDLDALMGDIQKTPLSAIIADLEDQQRTGTLWIFGAENGRLDVHEGRGVWAELGRHKGHEAVYAMMGLSVGRFSFATDAVDPARSNLTDSIKSLLFEGMRLLDERGR